MKIIAEANHRFRFFFRSGNAEHPSDKFYNTTVEVLPAEANQYGNSLNVTSDGYIVVGKSRKCTTQIGFIADALLATAVALPENSCYYLRDVRIYSLFLQLHLQRSFMHTLFVFADTFIR